MTIPAPGSDAPTALLERARDRLELLSAAGERLSGSLQPQAIVHAMAALVVPRLADWCRIDLLGADGRLEQVVMHHRDPARRAEGERAARAFRASPETDGSMDWCIRHGRAHLQQAPSADALVEQSAPELVDVTRRFGFNACFVTPLVARGRTLGAFAVMQAESRRLFDPEDVALVAELARRAALALDNARLFAEADAARREAEAANRAKDEFLAMLGHELRNPLAPIATALQVMDKRGDAGSAPERALIERQVAHLARLVDDLLDVARITRGDLRLQRERVALRSVLAVAVEMAGPVVQARRHRLELKLPPEDLVCDADPHRLAQVFANLLANAARYTPEGGWIQLRHRLDATAGMVIVQVRDSGQGISAEMLPRVFDLFVQGQQGPERSSGGLGIGLALVRNLVGLHGGRVEATSEGLGHGSTFSVRLPMAAAASVQAAEPAPPAPAAVSTPRRVLVVDDNIDAAHSLAELLRLLGHSVETAYDPVQALVRGSQSSFDLALLDIGLPGMDGYELAAQLRCQAWSAGCRFVALSGYAQPQDRARSLAAGFDEHLAKPIELRSLERLLAD
ncbi:hybrid sensor histidine kinase/response regulator [Ideonella sp. YS5]|uniref:hybrid sensor histidine kinase/response regulator n=1 Tax=Ideonella sp. YS5 TaxID=3453714 RepID=UPI003EEDD51A